MPNTPREMVAKAVAHAREGDRNAAYQWLDEAKCHVSFLRVRELLLKLGADVLDYLGLTWLEDPAIR